MREGPAFTSKVDSQAIFSEQVTLHERLGDWLLIATPDGYSGWVLSSSVIKRSELYSTDLEVSRLSAHVYAIPDVEFGPLLTLPFGSKLESLDFPDPRWMKVILVDGNIAYIQKGDVAPEPPISQKGELAAFSKKFLGLPYTWGGRSSFGYDCSGFVQMLYGRLSIFLPRNARQQILYDRFKPIDLEEMTPGDLLFFGKSEEKILHVGMFLERNSFIHTSSRENKPYLRISLLDDFEWSSQKGAFYPFRTSRTIRDCQLSGKRP